MPIAHRVGPQNTQHDALAVVGRQRADAEVDLLLADLHLDAAVLGQALLGDVDAGHDLEAGDDRGPACVLGMLSRLDADAVDAVAHADAVGHRLDVNVGGPHADGLGDDQVDQLDDRGVGVVLGGGLLVARLPRAWQVGVAVDLLDRLVHAGARRRVEEGVDEALDLALRGQGALDLHVQPEAQHVEQLQVERVGDDDLEPVVLAASAAGTCSCLDDLLAEPGPGRPGRCTFLSRSTYSMSNWVARALVTSSSLASSSSTRASPMRFLCSAA